MTSAVSNSPFENWTLIKLTPTLLLLSICYLWYVVVCGIFLLEFSDTTSHPSQIKVSRKRWFIYLPGLYLHPRSHSHGGQCGRSKCRWKKTRRKWHVCYAVLRYISYVKSSGVPSPLSNYSPGTGILHTIRHVYRSVWPARKLSLALVPRSHVLRMLVALAHNYSSTSTAPFPRCINSNSPSNCKGKK